MRICTSCTNKLPLSRFSKKGNGYRTTCKDCHNRYVREVWYPKNRNNHIQSVHKYRSRNYVKNKAWIYGIDPNILEKAFMEAKGKCAICRKKAKLVIDHNHKTGKFRGLLCGPCNKGLGFFRDNKRSLIQAIEYL